MKLKLSFGLVISAVFLGTAGGCSEKPVFDVNAYSAPRYKLIESTNADYKQFEKVAHFKMCLDVLLDYGFVEDFWNNLHSNKSVRKVHLTMESGAYAFPFYDFKVLFEGDDGIFLAKAFVQHERQTAQISYLKVERGDLTRIMDYLTGAVETGQLHTYIPTDYGVDDAGLSMIMIFGESAVQGFLIHDIPVDTSADVAKPIHYIDSVFTTGW